MGISSGGGARGLTASLEDRVLARWVNDRIPGVAAPLVLTDGPAAGDQPGVYYNLVAGDYILVQQIFFGVNTTADSCDFEIGWTDAPAGAGTFHPIDMKRYVLTAAIGDGTQTFGVTFDPPLQVLRYVDGVRSITFRVTANDATCEIACCWRGWRESV